MKRKIKYDGVYDAFKLIREIPFSKIDGKGMLFFPIDKPEIESMASGVIVQDEVTNISQGAAPIYIPGLLLSSLNFEGEINFSYATIRFASSFDIKNYLLLQTEKIKLDKSDIEELSNFECYLITPEMLAFSVRY